MKMNKLATLFLTTTLTLASGAAFADDSPSQSNNGQANAAASAGQTAPDAKANLEPNTTTNGSASSGMKLNTEKHTNSHTGTKHMTKDEIHKNSQCKDGKCPDINKKVQTGNGINNDTDTKTDGTTQ